MTQTIIRLLTYARISLALAQRDVIRATICLFAGVGLILSAFLANAAGTWQWTAQIVGNNMPVLGPFATKEQAVQAMEAAIVQQCASVGLPSRRSPLRCNRTVSLQ